MNISEDFALLRDRLAEHDYPNGRDTERTCPFATLWRIEQKLNEMYTALAWMADYNMTGTERTLHIDFQGKAREVLGRDR